MKNSLHKILILHRKIVTREFWVSMVTYLLRVTWVLVASG